MYFSIISSYCFKDRRYKNNEDRNHMLYCFLYFKMREIHFKLSKEKKLFYVSLSLQSNIILFFTHIVYILKHRLNSL